MAKSHKPVVWFPFAAGGTVIAFCMPVIVVLGSLAAFGHVPPGLGYELGARFVPPEQIGEIVATLQSWGYRDEDLRALLGGNLMRLARTVWKAPADA